MLSFPIWPLPSFSLTRRSAMQQVIMWTMPFRRSSRRFWALIDRPMPPRIALGGFIWGCGVMPRRDGRKTLKEYALEQKEIEARYAIKVIVQFQVEAKKKRVPSD